MIALVLHGHVPAGTYMIERCESGDGKKLGSGDRLGGKAIAEDDFGDAVKMHDRRDGPGQACSSASSCKLGLET